MITYGIMGRCIELGVGGGRGSGSKKWVWFSDHLQIKMDDKIFKFEHILIN